MNILNQFHKRLQQYKLTEGFKTKDSFNVKSVVSPVSIKKWSEKSDLECIKAAKKGSQSAQEYLFYRMEQAIQGAFWRNFLGPNGQMRRYRIQHENAWEEWLGIAWQAMTGGYSAISSTQYKKGEDAYTDSTNAENRDYETGKGGQHRAKGALEYLKLDKLTDKNCMQQFAILYKQRLIAAAVNDMTYKNSGGLSGKEITGGAQVHVDQYEPTWSEKGDGGWNPDGDDTVASGDYENETFDIVDDKLSSEFFLKKWKQFVQDPALQKNIKGISIKDIFAEAIGNKDADFKSMVKKFGVARNTIETYLHKAQDIMKQYNINGNDLMQAIKFFGNDKIASYM